MTQFVTNQAAEIGTVPAIPNALASAALDTAILVDPVKIQAYRESVADQMNAQSAGPTFEDLSERIAGIRIETAAQGASILVVDLIDPFWVLPMSGFIAVDEYGYLWPPIDINFPTGTDCVWRLCQYKAVWSQELDAPNLTLTFEDRIASLLREMSPTANGGISQGQSNQTLGGFFKELVDNANQNLKPRPKIRLVELISPQDPNYIPVINDPPASAEGPLRKQPFKDPFGLSQEQVNQLNQIANQMSQLFGDLSELAKGGKTIQEIEANAPQHLGLFPADPVFSPLGAGPGGTHPVH